MSSISTQLVCSYCAVALAALVAPLIWLPHPRPSAFGDLRAAQQIPPQQVYSPAPDPGVPAFFDMGDPRALDSIVRDVSTTAEGAGWRWTYVNPTLRFHLKDATRRRFSMDFSIVENVIRSTGALTLTCRVNGHELQQVHCPRAGDYHLEKEAPADWLASDPVIVEAALDKLWTAPADGARLGYVLLRAGFVQ